MTADVEPVRPSPNSRGIYDFSTPEYQDWKDKHSAWESRQALQVGGSNPLGGSSAASTAANNFTVTGSPSQQQGALQGINFGQMLYGQTMPQVGEEAADYSSKVKERLNTDYAGADVYRQNANRRIAQSAGKLGMAGASMGGAKEQSYRESGMAASSMNQDYKDKALALYGRNISSKQQGMAGQYMAGAGLGQAATPGVTPQYSSNSLGCLALVSIGLMSKETYASESPFINTSSYEYIGYTLLVIPFIPLILKNGRFAKFFSVMAHKYVLNLTGAKKSIIGRLIGTVGGSFCSLIGRLC
jgi:hypothetical protein